MPKTKKVKAAGRFKCRYGIRVRRKIAEIEELQRKKQECLYCGKQAATRVAYGIYRCKACGKKFAGKAYVAK
jgi:large subunit ribosomal protein L37Ae